MGTGVDPQQNQEWSKDCWEYLAVPVLPSDPCSSWAPLCLWFANKAVSALRGTCLNSSRLPSLKPIRSAPRRNPASTLGLEICLAPSLAMTYLFPSATGRSGLTLPCRTAPSWHRKPTHPPTTPPPGAPVRLNAALPAACLQPQERPPPRPLRPVPVPTAGSPSALRVLAAVQEGHARVNSKEGYIVDLVFSTESYNPEEDEPRLGKCSARVFFKNQKPRPAVNITCTRLVEKKKRQQEDYQLYKQMKQLKNPLDVASIPDSHGHIDPALRPIWDLAFLGSSYVMWEKTTPFLHYYLTQLTSVKQWKTNDDAIEFDYTVLLHEFSTQEMIPCRIHLLWYPGKPLKVKYHCQELQTPEEASGTEEGSAIAPTKPSNF
ncbi:retinoic acid receptor responder protein 1 [Carlito syrichta]|uniref:Retinoic acid receptor responder protein 1 n=1 Tax=Carlito syrichta TaxID=1868482 RepID=A0A1U7UAS0_CARSF|nr:retinoic acid receptor responder protein 1 [Carlito syrichta]